MCNEINLDSANHAQNSEIRTENIQLLKKKVVIRHYNQLSDVVAKVERYITFDKEFPNGSLELSYFCKKDKCIYSTRINTEQARLMLIIK